MSDLNSIESESLPPRMRGAVSLAWSLFSRKVGNGLVEINKEASMQLQFACILQQLLPLITFQPDEQVRLELETGAMLMWTWPPSKSVRACSPPRYGTKPMSAPLVRLSASPSMCGVVPNP